MSAKGRGRQKERRASKERKQLNELWLLERGVEKKNGRWTNSDDIQKELEEAAKAASTSSKVVDYGEMLAKKLRAAREASKGGPHLNLVLDRLRGAHLSHTEIRDLVHFSVIGPAVARPRWCYLKPWKSTSQTIVIRVNCRESLIEKPLPFVEEFFKSTWVRMDPVIGDRNLFWSHLLHVPVTLQERVREKVKALSILSEEQRNSAVKLELLVTSEDMVDFSYVWPPQAIPTRDKYRPLTPSSPVFALDCEMVLTDVNGVETSELARISLDGTVVLDTLVKPRNRIKDYVTKFSGITEKMLRDVTVRLEDVQKALRRVLPSDAILCGHSLEFDLKALKMSHPYCIDIAFVYNISGTRRQRTSLRSLVSLFLQEDIQVGGFSTPIILQGSSDGHCSVEDAWATMRLLRLKLEKGLVFGNCMFGWSYDKFIKENETTAKKRKLDEEEDEEKDEGAVDEDLPPVMCACGRSAGVACRLPNCVCRQSPLSECVICLGREEPEVDDIRDTFDWSAALRVDNDVLTRPLNHYLCDSKKTVLLGMRPVDGDTFPRSRFFTLRDPSGVESRRHADDVAAELLEYGLAMVELEHSNGESSLMFTLHADDAKTASEQVNASLENLLRSAARFALVIVVMASEAKSICFMKVKHAH